MYSHTESAVLAREAALKHHSDDQLKVGGVHYTPQELARFVADQITESMRLRGDAPVSICDPAAGNGELLASLLSSLRDRGVVNVDVHGFELNQEAARYANDRLTSEFPLARVAIECGDFLRSANGQGDQFDLFGEGHPKLQCDAIIANPPYVRTQILGAGYAQELAHQFGLEGRVDLYHAFLLAISGVLTPGGTCGVIVSNRFMTTRSGASVRKELTSRFDLVHIWDLGDSKLFHAAVLPAVLLMNRKGTEPFTEKTRFTSIYSTKEGGAAIPVRSPLDALSQTGVVEMPDGSKFKVASGTLNCGTTDACVWRGDSDLSANWLQTVSAHTWKSFGEVAKVRVGVKTTADKVFIRKDWALLPSTSQPELLRPLTTHHSASRFRARTIAQPRYILYPHCVSGGQRRAVDLALFPKSKEYLEAHRERLESRDYVAQSGRQWYEIWVPQDPGAWDKPKIVFRDICEEPTFWIDLEGTVVNGDCYWIGGIDSDQEDLLWLLLAIGNSTFIESFYDIRFNNKLYSGRRRFMTQYVEQFPVPDPTRQISQDIVCLAKRIYSEVSPDAAAILEGELDVMVHHSFGLVPEARG